MDSYLSGPKVVHTVSELPCLDRLPSRQCGPHHSCCGAHVRNTAYSLCKTVTVQYLDTLSPKMSTKDAKLMTRLMEQNRIFAKVRDDSDRAIIHSNLFGISPDPESLHLHREPEILRTMREDFASTPATHFETFDISGALAFLLPPARAHRPIESV